MFQPMPSAFGAFRRLALTVFWPCLLFVVVGLLIVLPSAPVTLTPYGLIPPVVGALGVVLVLKVLDPRKTPAKRPDKAAVVQLARSMFFARLLTGEVAVIVGLVVGMATYNQTPLLAGLVTAVLLYTWWLRTENFLDALHRVLDPVGAGQLTDAVIKR
ncbi:hypothetical protein [Kutzneria sp. CA-103260]|uniref:hypothetical protein n=1 Tax=Kutzneria sp. CA-103260 TaxID=2802641 RepID=UPI001BA541C8|nr:hypothetical protein [Kutzneria sp. CA-103260]QUQ70071.1 hypothetical protein JJ691_78420 [Kutzneria sp. CA-103260]